MLHSPAPYPMHDHHNWIPSPYSFYRVKQPFNPVGSHGFVVHIKLDPTSIVGSPFSDTINIAKISPHALCTGAAVLVTCSSILLHHLKYLPPPTPRSVSESFTQTFSTHTLSHTHTLTCWWCSVSVQGAALSPSGGISSALPVNNKLPMSQELPAPLHFYFYSSAEREGGKKKTLNLHGRSAESGLYFHAFL